MTQFELFTPETAPEDSKEALQSTVDKYGLNLNIFAHMAQSPLPIKLYNYGQDLLNKEGTLTPEEVNLVQLAISVFNLCEFCVPAHSGAARGTFKTDDAIVDAIRNSETVPDARIDALVTFTQILAEKRGQVSDADTSAFLEAGFTKAQIFEVLSIVAYKTITNYTSNIAGTKPNAELAGETWTPNGAQQQRAAA